MSAPAVHCITGSFRPHINGLHAGMLRTIAAVEGDENDTAAICRIIEAAYMALPSADSVDAGKPCSVAPERPEGGPGQGEAQPPAPTNEAGPFPIYDKSEVIATPRPHVHIGFLPKGCVFGEECGR